MRERLAQLAQSAYPEWTDHSAANFGNLMLDLFAYVADVLGKYIYRQAGEGRLATVTQRENAVALARMLGYTPAGATAARAAVSFSLDTVNPAPVSIPAGYIVKTRDVTPPVEFRVFESIVIPPGQLTAKGTVEHSQTHKQVVDSSGLPDQRVPLTHGRYLDKSVSVRSTEQGEFTEVATFLDSTPGDQHFVIFVGQSDQATVCFGNGVMGVAPKGRLDITYKTGGGSDGNVNAGSISVPGAPLLDGGGRPVRVRVTNPGAATGGSDRESIDSIRQRAPASLRRAQRTITREDFESNALRVPGVARALMTTTNEDKKIEANTGRLYIVPEGLEDADGFGEADAELAKAVHRQVTHTYPCTLTFQVDIGRPTYLPIEIDADVEATTPEQNIQSRTAVMLEPSDPHGALRGQVEQRLRQLFALNLSDGTPNPRANFGYYLGASPGERGDVPWSDVVTAICGTAGIRKVLSLKLNGEQQDVEVQPFAFPYLKAVNLRFAEYKASAPSTPPDPVPAPGTEPEPEPESGFEPVPEIDEAEAP